MSESTSSPPQSDATVAAQTSGLHKPPADSSNASPPATPPATQPVSQARSRAGVAVGSLALIAVAAIAVWLMASRRASASAAEAAQRVTQVASGKTVRTALVAESPSVRQVDQLGEARPFATVTLYAKVAGYLKTVNVDVGDRLKAGDVVATIESPETDRALASARADFENKQLTSTRVAQLLQKKLVSPQEADQARTEAAMANERLEALREQQAYETLRAPFAGRVTARFADPGALAQNAASSQTSALPVVTVSQADSLRVLVYLDQGDAAIVHPGTPAVITMTERPGVQIPVRVSRIAGELDPKTRKMLTELDLENSRGLIVPGSFVNVRIDFPMTRAPQAPVEALVVRGGNTFVGTIDDHSRLHLTPVTIASNDGKMVTFASGVQPGVRVALNLGSSAVDGDRIQVDTSTASVSK